MAHAITYLHMYTGKHFIFNLIYLDQIILQKFMLGSFLSFFSFQFMDFIAHSFPIVIVWQRNKYKTDLF